MITLKTYNMKKIIYSLVIYILFATFPVEAVINPTLLKCENLNNPQAIDVVKPRLSWVNVAGNTKKVRFRLPGK